MDQMVRRRVGKLSAEAATGLSKHRLLEVLYCECCGTQLLSGFRIPLSNVETELSFLPGNPEQLPDDGSVVRTDEADYATIGVIYLLPTKDVERPTGLRAGGRAQLLEGLLEIPSLGLKRLGNRLSMTLKVV